MSSEVFEEPLELEIEILEAGPPTLGSYPYPSLAPSGRSTKRTFRSVILENPYVRATVVPTLGGRILSLFDKRTATEVLPPPRVVDGGRRGAMMVGGLELHLDGAERLTALAPVQSAAHESDEGQPAVLWLSEGVTGSGLSWHLRITLPPDRATLEIEARIFNRTFREIEYNSGLLLPGFVQILLLEDSIVGHTDGNGIAILSNRSHWYESNPDQRLCVTRFAGRRPIAPRQTDTWSCSILPISHLPGAVAAGIGGSIGIDGNRLSFQSAEPIENHKLVLLTGEGQTMEALVTARPEHISEFDLATAPAAVALLNPAKQVLLSWKAADLPRTGSPVEPPRSGVGVDSRKLDREAARFDVATRHAVLVLDAIDSLRQGEYADASAALEQSLLYDGEDHLAWWMKAISHRLLGEEGESAELLNAHYLAPLEPVLRAESFLAQPRRVEREPSELLTPMAEHPENFIEVACLLLELGLYEQGAYWIDEALRHEELSMLRYLLAFTHLESSGLEYEAASHVEAAGKSALGPPYPWRDLEWTAIEKLAQRFPADSRLQELLALRNFAQP